MKNLIGITVLALLLTSGFCQNESNSTIEPTPGTTIPDTTVSTSIPTTSTTTVTTSTSTTPVPTTSTTPDITTTSTETTSTSTTPSSTTTDVPVTTTDVPVTTTDVPVTTPDVPVTTSEPPVPVTGSWNVTDGNTTCIRADLQIRFKIPVKDSFEYINLLPNATTDGSTCEGFNGTQELHLSTESEYSVVMSFEKDSTSVYMKNISLIYKVQDKTEDVYNDTRLFSVQSGNSYLCSSMDNVPLMNVTMEVYHVHIQAFGSEGNKDFGTAEECESDNKVDDLVPIAVGCALLGLVVIVLIAYFVGRRRSRQKGYQSV